MYMLKQSSIKFYIEICKNARGLGKAGREQKDGMKV